MTELPALDPALSLRVRRIEGAPLIAIRVVLAGGARCEEIPGRSLVTGRMLAEGTRRRDWAALAEAVESLGMSSAGYGGFESHGLVVDALAMHWRRALDLAAEQLFESSFPEERVRWVTRHAAAELAAQADQADLLTARAFAELLYAPHPRGRPLQGDAASLERLTPDLCREFHAAALTKAVQIVVAGEIDEATLAAAAAEKLSGLEAVPGARAEPPPPPPASARRREITTRARDQAHLFIGQLTVPRSHPDYAALEVAGVILGSGAGLSGRIPSRIRDREGLAYAAAADTVAGAGLDAGRLTVYVGTSPENLEQAERGVREELERLLDGGVSESEVEEARSYLLGREPFRRESARQWADLAAQGALLGLPLEDLEWRRNEIAAVTRAEVERALRRHVDVAELAVAVGLPLSSTPAVSPTGR